MANETLQQILTAQNTYITNGNAARTRAESKLDTALDALADLASYRYPVAQGVTMQTALDDDYAAICAANEGFADRGAVGITVLARDGDVISANGYPLFINGSQIAGESYAFPAANAGQVALLRCWYFANGAGTTLELLNGVALSIVEYVEKNSVSVHKSYYAFADRAVYNRTYIPRPAAYWTSNYNSAGANTNRYLEIYGIDTEGTSYNPGNLMCQTLVHHCRTLTGSFGNSNLPTSNITTMRFPDLLTINSETCLFNVMSNVIFDKLETITGSLNYKAANAAFFRMISVILPETVDTITGNLFSQNSAIDLRCKNASSIDSRFCTGAPTAFTMCGDWGASINISVAAANWLPDKFGIPPEDNTSSYYLLNLLKKFTYVEDAHKITIPKAYVTDALITAYQAKGWDLLGG